MTTMTQAITESNEKAPAEFRLICPGLTINVNDQDLLILACKKLSERVIGDCYASWVVLVKRDDSHRDPWVVWVLIATPYGWALESGSYCMTEEEGRKAFAFRT